ncbi:MAG: hypothetical protein A2580_17890 [Hydrogenophilales bacterium RIFOXYD1_FULL_62_11]|nr:MAG: hypothetical protein A2580_17890 [Hydrogenophilales bacterium RIFOXYD1_FULL_62_11]
MTPVDGARTSFHEIATRLLPAHLQRLREAMRTPVPAATFLGATTASRVVRERAGVESDFRGLYVFIEQGKPLYVGISRKVLSRLVQHVNAPSHFSASLAYRLACREHWPGGMPRGRKRAQNMDDGGFLERFKDQQRRLSAMDVAFVQIDCDLELYLFEVYAAMQLGTGALNSFRTH